MDFFEVIEQRRSVRAFKKDKVNEETLKEILEAVIQAPSAGNLQSFKVYITKHNKIKKNLADAAHGQSFIAEAPIVLVFCADYEQAASRYGNRGKELYAVQDATIATAYAQLAAQALGLSSVWIGAFDESAVKKAIGYGKNLEAVAILPIGKPSEHPIIPPRRLPSELFKEL